MNEMLIKDYDIIKTKLSELSSLEFFSLDTEFVRKTTFYPQPCLIQFADLNTAFAIDVTESIKTDQWLKTKECIKNFFLNTNSVAVIHAADQDAELLIHEFGLPNYLFDTQLAARFIGFSSPPSYAAIVEHYFGLTLGKELQFSDWDKRPLSREHIEYAISDVTYLSRLYPVILQDLIKLGRLEWFLEDSSHNKKKYLKTKKDSYVELKKALNKLSSIDQILMCYKILEARDMVAKKRNIAKRFIIKDDSIIHFLHSNKDIRSLNMTDNCKNDFTVFFHQLEETKCEWEKNVTEIIEEHKEHPHGYKKDKKFFHIKSLLRDAAKSINVADDLIATTKDINKIIAGKQSRVNSGWRYEVLGKKLGLPLYQNPLKSGE